MTNQTTAINFEGMKYRELQKEASARKIKFIGVKTVDLIAALVQYETDLANQSEANSQPEEPPAVVVVSGELQAMKTDADAVAIRGEGTPKQMSAEEAIENTREMLEIVSSEEMSVSEKIRALTKLDIERKEIAKLLDVRYQFVRNVQVRDQEKTTA